MKYGLAWIVTVAEVCHEVNKAYCESIGDGSQQEWKDAPQWQKDSAIKGVEAHLVALDSGATLTPRESHEAWLIEKAAAGWKYGPVKDQEKKEHPCYVAYDELPQAERVKDYLFRAVCKVAHRQYNE